MAQLEVPEQWWCCNMYQYLQQLETRSVKQKTESLQQIIRLTTHGIGVSKPTPGNRIIKNSNQKLVFGAVVRYNGSEGDKDDRVEKGK